ncbi:sulfotransferase [Microlunatus elymi]|uniref:Trehalose 2-sulfotransferase n=1 Tax=Microlunatus elymi TaxID=2596828 RepID=A0A516PWT7_9ACTN|nr:Stf0 family sulfotransferase [Microlunatus elymi]QDP95647.1 sulfotransferase [Microlunatus elymi]
MTIGSGAGGRFESYVLCTSPRSGSTLLCSLLAATGLAGNPKSFFHEPSVANWSAHLLTPPGRRGSDLDYARTVVDAAIAEGTNSTGVFGLRLQRHSFDFLLGKLALLHPEQMSDADRFRAAFGRTLFIHLTRADKIAQAVSCVIAQQTGLWHMAPDGTALERVKEHQDPVYDGPALRRTYDETVELDRQWLSWFASEAIEPLRLSYDRLSVDPLSVLREVLRALRLDEGAADGVAIGVKKLANGTNRDWARRLRAELDTA